MIIVSAAVFTLYALSTVLFIIVDGEYLYLFWGVSLASSLFVYLYWLRRITFHQKKEKFADILQKVCVLLNLLIIMIIFYESLSQTYDAEFLSQTKDFIGSLIVLSLLYLIWFASSSLVTKELGRSAKFHETLGTFLVILCLPIGMFFLKNRINDGDK